MRNGDFGYNGGPLVDPRTGQLRDFIPKTGDLPPSAFENSSTRQRWGRRVQLATSDSFAAQVPSNPRSNRATLISTETLPRDYPINVQMRFAQSAPASPDPTAMPNSAAFSYINPVVLGATLTITLRRGIDPNAPVGVEQFSMPLGTANDMVPFDIITTKALGVDVEITGTAASIWVEAWAAIVTDVSRLNRVPGYTFTQGPLGGAGLQVTAVADPANVTLLVARKARTEFYIVNTSNAAMAILFSDTGNAGFAAPRATVILPGGNFSQFQGQWPCYNGRVTATWQGAAPTGGALVTEGANWQ